MSQRRVLVIVTILVCLGACALAENEGQTQVQNWTAPPYWTSPASAGPMEGIVVQSTSAELLPPPETDILPFTAITPCRLLDTYHRGADGGAFASAETRTYDFTSGSPVPFTTHCPGLPSNVGAWSLSFQLNPTSQNGYLAAYAGGTSYTPGSFSTMVGTTGVWTVTPAVVPAGTGTYLGQVSIYSQRAAHLIIDVNGYYAAQPVVTTLNGLTGDVGVTGGTGISVSTDSGTNTITVASTLPAGPTGPTGAAGPPGPTGPTGAAPHYAQVVVVAKSGGDFTLIQAALTSITDASDTKRYLVWVGPGVYSEQVTMKQYVDIEGAGELATKVTNTGGANENSGATVRGANDAELRFITVENTGGAAYAVGVFNSTRAVRLTHVTATAFGATDGNAGVCNFVGSSSVMTFVSATGTGGQFAYGVENSASSPTMTNVTATGKDGSVFNHGVMNMVASAPAMHMVNAAASGGGSSYGVKNESGSDPDMSEVIADASGASTSNYGIYNLNSSPTIRSSVVTALSGTGSKIGMYNYATTGGGDNSVMIQDCRVGGFIYGIRSEVAIGATGTTLTVRVIHSWVSGPTNSIYGDDRALTYVGTSQLLGGAVHDGGAGAPMVRCYACYDENFTNPGTDAAKIWTCP